MNLCKDCKWVRVDTRKPGIVERIFLGTKTEMLWEFAKCFHPTKMKQDKVSGVKTAEWTYCSSERMIGVCGPGAKDFEKRDGRLAEYSDDE